jgi:predicted lipid-binding transport protein (Tim44 family)
MFSNQFGSFQGCNLLLSKLSFRNMRQAPPPIPRMKPLAAASRRRFNDGSVQTRARKAALSPTPADNPDSGNRLGKASIFKSSDSVSQLALVQSRQAGDLLPVP